MRLYNLQALRGLACLMVVVYHVATKWCPDGVVTPVFAPFLYFGFGGVDLFFVLSGFVITWVSVDTLGDRSRLAGYLGRRLWRIYPLYWVCWLLAIPLDFSWAATFWLRHPKTWPQNVPVLRPLLLLPSNVPNVVVPQAWTLSYEILFYVTFALFFVLPRRAFLPSLGLWFIAVAVTSALPPTIRPGPESVIGLLVKPHITEFLLGCFVAMTVRRGITSGGRLALGAGVAGFAIGGLALRWWPAVAGPISARVPLFCVPAALIVYGAVAIERSLGCVLPRWLQSVGDASYPIYLIHIGIFELVHRNLSALAYDLPGALTTIVVAIGGALAAGFVLHFLIERPLMNLARRRPAPRRYATALNAAADRRAA